MDSGQIQVVERPKQRFERQKSQVGRNLAEFVRSPCHIHILDAHTLPYVGSPRERRSKSGETRRPLRENLKCMPASSDHRIEDLSDEADRHLFVIQIAHRVYEYPSRLPPLQWQTQAIWPEAQIKALLVRVTWSPPETLRKAFRVAVFASLANLRATCHRI